MERSTIQKITLGFGVVYALIGVLGFIPGITTRPANPGPVPGEGLLLGIFAVNAVHNVAHLALGAILIWGVTGEVAGLDLDAIGVILLVVGALGLLLSLIFWSSWGGPAYFGGRRRTRYVEEAPPPGY